MIMQQALPILIRTYWACTVGQLSTGACKHTHVELKNVRAEYVASESDGDQHIRLRQVGDTVTAHFIVAECIPLLPCRRVHVGDILTSVKGITRKDSEHGWMEVHPVEALQP